MVTSAIFYHLLNFLNITIEIRNICVFLAPFFSSLTVIVTYLLTTELSTSAAGLVAACLISIVPGYISRSVAGSYDNEGIAIFCMLLTYFLWIKAVKTGSIYWASVCAVAYFYMVSSWGGYVFLINLIPMHVFALMCVGKFSHKIYVAYSVVYCLGTLLSMQISFVGFAPIQSSEHMAAFGVFGLCQLFAFYNYCQSKLSGEQFAVLFKALATLLAAALLIVASILTITGSKLHENYKIKQNFFKKLTSKTILIILKEIAPWTGRFYSLLDPSYAKNNIPIIASVSEHQPTSWSSFYFDLQFLMTMFPVGIYYCFKNLTDANIFIVLYGMTSIYFAGVMVRLMLVLAPVMCILSGIGISAVLVTYMKNIESESKADKKLKKSEDNYPNKSEVNQKIYNINFDFIL